MSLNAYRDEARDFLERIGALDEGNAPKLKLLEEELHLLKQAVNADEKDKIRHQIYDMLFLLFEIAADSSCDLDDEWDTGRARKATKYTESQPTARQLPSSRPTIS